MGPWSLAVHPEMEGSMDTEKGLDAGVNARQEGQGRVKMVVGRVVVGVLAIALSPEGIERKQDRCRQSHHTNGTAPRPMSFTGQPDYRNY